MLALVLALVTQTQVCPSEYSQACLANLGGHDCAWVTGCTDNGCCRAISTCSGFCVGDSCVMGATCYCRWELDEACAHVHAPHSHAPHALAPHAHAPHALAPHARLGAGAVAGISVGAVAGVGALALGTVLFARRKRRGEATDALATDKSSDV